MTEGALRTSDFALLSRAFRAGLLRYELTPTERDLAHLLCLVSFDAGLARGRVDLDGWCRRLGIRDGKGWRPDKLERCLRSLRECLVADINAAEGTFALQADAQLWSRARGLRSAECGVRSVESGLNLDLRAERPLSEALSDLGRGNVLELAHNPGGGDSLAASEANTSQDHAAGRSAKCEVRSDGPQGLSLRRMFEAELSADKSAESGMTGALPVSEKSAETQVAVAEAPRDSAEKSADTAIALASEACTNKAKAKLKLATTSAEKSAEALEWLRCVDNAGALGESWVRAQWEELCARDPGWVLNRGAGALENHQARLAAGDRKLQPIENVLAWLSRKARDEGKLRSKRDEL